MHLFNLQIDDTDNDFTIMFYGLLRLQAPSAPSFMLMGNMVTDAIVILFLYLPQTHLWPKHLPKETIM